MNADLLFHVLLALAVVVVAARLVGVIVARVGQPPVIGEVLAGILLGPSLLGAIAPGVEAFLFPESARPARILTVRGLSRTERNRRADLRATWQRPAVIRQARAPQEADQGVSAPRS